MRRQPWLVHWSGIALFGGSIQSDFGGLFSVYYFVTDCCCSFEGKEHPKLTASIGKSLDGYSAYLLRPYRRTSKALSITRLINPLRKRSSFVAATPAWVSE